MQGVLLIDILVLFPPLIALLVGALAWRVGIKRKMSGWAWALGAVFTLLAIVTGLLAFVLTAVLFDRSQGAPFAFAIVMIFGGGTAWIFSLLLLLLCAGFFWRFKRSRGIKDKIVNVYGEVFTQ